MHVKLYFLWKVKFNNIDFFLSTSKYHYLMSSQEKNASPRKIYFYHRTKTVQRKMKNIHNNKNMKQPTSSTHM